MTIKNRFCFLFSLSDILQKFQFSQLLLNQLLLKTIQRLLPVALRVLEDWMIKTTHIDQAFV